MFISDPFKPDPGPCPVCDAPHTTCTSPGYTGQQERAVVVRPMVPATSVTVSPTSFTTSSYRRAVHGREAAATKQARR